MTVGRYRRQEIKTAGGDQLAKSGGSVQIQTSDVSEDLGGLDG